MFFFSIIGYTIFTIIYVLIRQSVITWSSHYREIRFVKSISPLDNTQTRRSRNVNYTLQQRVRPVSNFATLLDQHDVSYGVCTTIESSSLVARTAVWQDVSAERSDILVYSAFWESRLSSPTVLILGLKNLSYTDLFTCLLWYQHQQHPVATEATAQPVIVDRPVRWEYQFLLLLTF